MAEDGEEKLLKMVQHIVQTLGSSDTMTEDDILKVFSNYGGRLSLDNIYAARGAAVAGGGESAPCRRRPHRRNWQVGILREAARDVPMVDVEAYAGVRRVFVDESIARLGM